MSKGKRHVWCETRVIAHSAVALRHYVPIFALLARNVLIMYKIQLFSLDLSLFRHLSNLAVCGRLQMVDLHEGAEVFTWEMTIYGTCVPQLSYRPPLQREISFLTTSCSTPCCIIGTCCTCCSRSQYYHRPTTHATRRAWILQLRHCTLKRTNYLVSKECTLGTSNPPIWQS